MDEFDPVRWEDIDRAFERTFYDCPAVYDARRDEFETDWWQGLTTVYDAWKTEHKRDGDHDQGAAYLLAYFAARDGFTVGPDADRSGDSLAGVGERRPDADTLERWFWDERRPMWAIAVRTGTHFALVKYWLREDDVPLMWRNFTHESRERLAGLD
jgi:hypothetical protein